jgi:hypothetical protein
MRFFFAVCINDFIRVCQLLAVGRWFSQDTPFYSTNKTEHLNITETLLKMAFGSMSSHAILPTLHILYREIYALMK